MDERRQRHFEPEFEGLILTIAFEVVHPNHAVLIPVHARMHLQNNILIGGQAGITFGLGVGFGHIAQALPLDGGNGKLHTFQDEGFIRISIQAVAALLGFGASQGSGDQFGMAHQPVDAAGFLGIAVCHFLVVR